MPKKLSFFLFLFLLLGGNPLSAEFSSPETENTETTFIGLTTDDLVKRRGSPSSVAVFPTGDSVWTYKLLKTERVDCDDPAVRIPDSENAKLAWRETEVFLIDSSFTIKSHSISID